MSGGGATIHGQYGEDHPPRRSVPHQSPARGPPRSGAGSVPAIWDAYVVPWADRVEPGRSALLRVVEFADQASRRREPERSVQELGHLIPVALVVDVVADPTGRSEVARNEDTGIL